MMGEVSLSPTDMRRINGRYAGMSLTDTRLIKWSARKNIYCGFVHGDALKLKFLNEEFSKQRYSVCIGKKSSKATKGRRGIRPKKF